MSNMFAAHRNAGTAAAGRPAGGFGVDAVHVERSVPFAYMGPAGATGDVDFPMIRVISYGGETGRDPILMNISAAAS